MMSDYEVEQEPGLSDFLPSGFGKQKRTANTTAQINLSKRNVPDDAKEIAAAQASDGDDSDNSDDDDDSSDDEDEFPVSHELIIKTHERPVTTATLEPSGARLITGSTDCTLKFHDFASMTPTTVRAFRSIDPSSQKGSANVETHPVHQATYNPISPSQILVISALPQAKIFNRDGEAQVTFVKGDMYLRDMHNTKGHISEVTCGAWHPRQSHVCVTAGTDSTLRIWDVNNPRSQKEVIVHKSRSAGSAGRTRMTAVAWGSPAQGGNSLLVGSAYDGSLAMWSGEGPYNRPSAEIRDAHVPDTWTSGVDISADGRLVVTRGGDDTVKTWDTRKFKSPIVTLTHPSMSSQYPTSSIRFSSDSSSILTGSGTGHLHILNPGTLKPSLVTPVTPGFPLITAFWHAKLNQIITTSANGSTHILYSPTASHYGGAKAVMLKAPKRRHIDDDPSLTTDTSLGMSGDAQAQAKTMSFASRHPTVGVTNSGRSRDPRRPHVPSSTPFAGNQPDAKYLKEAHPLSSMRDEDPREALLKYAETAEKEPIFTNAWSKTQPKTIYADISGDEEEGGGHAAKKAKR